MFRDRGKKGTIVNGRNDEKYFCCTLGHIPKFCVAFYMCEDFVSLLAVICFCDKKRLQLGSV